MAAYDKEGLLETLRRDYGINTYGDFLRAEAAASPLDIGQFTKRGVKSALDLQECNYFGELAENF